MVKPRFRGRATAPGKRRRLGMAGAALVFATALTLAAARVPASDYTTPYNVVWTVPSQDAAGSMPLGNGEVGLNLWVEPGGDVRFYISRSDSLSEISRLLKVGCVRIALSPNPLAAGGAFRQELVLRDGVCMITFGEGAQKATLRLFVDADYPVVHCLGESATPVSVKATVESWREEPHTLGNNEEANSAWTLHGSPTSLIEAADCFSREGLDAVCWYHRNEQSIAFPATLRVQSLESAADRAHDPLVHRTFGGRLTGTGFTAGQGHSLETTAPVQAFALRVAVPCVQAATAADWLAEAERLAAQTADGAAARTRTAAWWQGFWGRSRVVVSGGDTAAPAITRGYTLQRYVQACGGRGTYPIKFNGGIFTVEPKAMGKPFNPDFRAWGDCHWWQNVRHMYHPMLAAGDLEMMQPLFRLYEQARPLAETRTRLYHGAEGAYFPETMSVWGTYANGDYGWDRAGHQPKDVLCPWWQYAWNQGLELVSLMLDYWDYSGDETFLKTRAFPMAESVLKYFDTRFRKDAQGKIVLDPTQAVETFWAGVINDMPAVAGLNDVCPRLAALTLATPAQHAFFARMQQATPPMPLEEVTDGGRKVKVLAPAAQYERKRSNCENPELYAVWPFRQFGLGQPGLEEARAAYARRANHLDVGWGYDGNCAARLGLAEEAARILKLKCANSNPAYRWPATWGPNFDWLPDQNHGGNLLETAQLMLLQAEGDKLLLLPAWPKGWNVEFKLHAPRQTVVECTYRDGKVERLQVTPEARRKDVVLPGAGE